MPVIPIKPRLTGADVDALWDAYRIAADVLDEEVRGGAWRVETAAKVVDTYRAWCRAYTGVAFP